MKKVAINLAFLILVFFFSVLTMFAQQPLLTVDAGHSQTVFSVCFSPDNKYILSGSGDNTLKLWEISTGKMVRTFTGHTGWINSVCFTPDGLYALSGSNDKNIILWEVSTGKKVRTFSDHYREVNSVCISRDGKYILSGSDDKTAKLWKMSSGKVIETYNGSFEVESVCFSPDGEYIMIGNGFGNTVTSWEISTGRGSVFLCNDYVKSVSCSPDGNTLLVGCGFARASGTILLWEIPSIITSGTFGQSTHKLIRTFQGHSDGINSICFSSDGNTILSGSVDNTIKLWDVSTGIELKTFTGHTRDLTIGVSSVCFSPDGKNALSGGEDTTIKLWELASGKEKKTFSGHSEFPVSICLSPDGKYALSLVFGKNKFSLWELETGKVIRIFSGHNNWVWALCFSPDGKYALSGSLDNTLKLWDVLTGELIRTYNGHTDRIESICFSPDGKFILSGSFDKTIKLWNVSTGEVVKTLSSYSKYAYAVSISFTPDGKYALYGSSDNTLKLWDISMDKEVRTFTGHYFWVKSISYLPDGKQFLSGSWDNTLKLWDISSGQVVRTFIGHKEAVFSVCLSPDGKFALSGSIDKTLRLWDISSGKEIRTFLCPNVIESVYFFKDGKKAIYACSDNSIKILDLNTGNEIVSMFSYANDWLTVIPNMYFDSSKDGGQSVSMVVNNHGFNIDQLALKFNRPDIILQQIGNTDTNLIKHYYSQYKKRLRRNGFTEEQLSSEIHVPYSSISDIKQDGKFVSVSFNLNDDKYKLKRYNVFVNDVPLYGSYGKSLTCQKIDLTEKIELTYGENKIEVSCMNEKGAESFRALTYATYNEPVSKDLYLLAFGVSKYQNTSYNLKYADKDALDLSNVLESYKGKGFENIYTKVLTNEQVTPEAIKASKDFVKNAKPDDTFILFIAGHGMHDTDPEATYYYLTSNADINNLKGTAADFESIEDLLQGIPPRNKLFLMDACESGEIDEEDQGQMIAAATDAGIASRGFKNTSSQTTINEQRTTKRSYLYQKDRYIYNDLVRRSGAIVFSSSKGGELSYERSDIENGLFTEYIMKALTTTEADKDGNGTVSTDELREYVSSQVAKTSGDLQHPTVDRDNIYQKFGFSLR